MRRKEFVAGVAGLLIICMMNRGVGGVYGRAFAASPNWESGGRQEKISVSGNEGGQGKEEMPEREKPEDNEAQEKDGETIQNDKNVQEKKDTKDEQEGKNVEDAAETKENREESVQEQPRENRQAADSAAGEEESLGEESVSDNASKETPVMSLQVPDNLDFVIDPWNLSGNGQIYSRQFEIKNTGDTACMLYLQDIVCNSGKKDSVQFCKDASEIYESGTANVYMELVFASEETLVLTPQAGGYQVRLEPESGLVFWFTGRVNENSSENWATKELSVSLKYFCAPI